MQVTAMEEENALEVHEREIWLQGDQDDLLGMNDASMFYADFPPLPDFSCMSSSSSSSSAPALPVKTLTTSSSLSSTATSSSSSAASWAVLKSDAEDNIPVEDAPSLPPPPPPPSLATLSSTASTKIPLPSEHGGLPAVTAEDCMTTMEEPFPYMEMLEINDFFDPTLIFHEHYPLEELEYSQDHQTHHQEEHVITVQQQAEDQHQHQVVTSNNEEEKAEIQLGSEDGIRSPDCEMSDVFLEWLKTNRDSISANDLRSVKLKKSTIECAAKRLGGGKEAMKQLLKLILEWVQTSHLQNKRRNNKENDNNNNNSNINNSSAPSNFVTNPSTNSNPNSFGPWVSQPPPPYGTDPAAIVAAPPPNFPVIGYPSDPYSNGAPNSITSYQPGTEYNMLESAHSWPPSQFAIAPHYNQSFGDNNLPRANPPVNPGAATAFGGYGNQYPYQYFHGPTGDKMMTLGPSATKEARKKRMARQRRYLSHPRSQKHHGQVQNHSGDHDPLARLGTDHNCTAGVVNPANWMYWASLAGGGASVGPPVIPAEPLAGQPGLDRTALQTQNYHQGSRGVSSTDHRRQGWKPEKNLRFLLQKVLKQSDVGSLGRIVLPKKEAETHLPELEARDGISIAMEDIGTSRVWNMRYRYWPNNKSRMYLLENTGDFVKANGLQEGDFIVLYSDVKCGKFLIRGVKVRQAAYGAKTAETKKAAGKSQKTLGNANNDSPSPSSPQKKMRK